MYSIFVCGLIVTVTYAIMSLKVRKFVYLMKVIFWLTFKPVVFSRGSLDTQHCTFCMGLFSHTLSLADDPNQV